MKSDQQDEEETSDMWAAAAAPIPDSVYNDSTTMSAQATLSHSFTLAAPSFHCHVQSPLIYGHHHTLMRGDYTAPVLTNHHRQ